MNELLKQRLVGALILVALGVIFWPIVFVEPEDKVDGRQQSIPPPPAVSTAAVEAPDTAGLRASPELAANDDSQVEDEGGDTDETVKEPTAASSHSASKPAEPGVQSGAQKVSQAVRSEAPQRLAMDSEGVPVAWTLQVATVSSAAKAEDLRQRLLAMHQKAYIATISRGGKTLYRVCVGPKFERAELERQQAGINAEFGVTTMIVRYLP